MTIYFKYIVLFFFFVLFISCKKQNGENKIQSQKTIANEYEVEYNNKEKLNKLLENAIDNNDTNAYFEAFKIHVIANRYHEFLYYSIMMAEKNNFNQAYYDCYYLLTVKTKPNNLAMYYLLKAFEKGNEDAVDEIEELFPNKKDIPTSCSYLCK